MAYWHQTWCMQPMQPKKNGIIFSSLPSFISYSCHINTWLNPWRPGFDRIATFLVKADVLSINQCMYVIWVFLILLHLSPSLKNPIINVSTEHMKLHLMFTMFHQTLHVNVVSNTQNIQTSDWPKWSCA